MRERKREGLIEKIERYYVFQIVAFVQQNIIGSMKK